MNVGNLYGVETRAGIAIRALFLAECEVDAEDLGQRRPSHAPGGSAYVLAGVAA